MTTHVISGIITAVSATGRAYHGQAPSEGMSTMLSTSITGRIAAQVTSATFQRGGGMTTFAPGSRTQPSSPDRLWMTRLSRVSRSASASSARRMSLPVQASSSGCDAKRTTMVYGAPLAGSGRRTCTPRWPGKPVAADANRCSRSSKAASEPGRTCLIT